MARDKFPTQTVHVMRKICSEQQKNHTYSCDILDVGLEILLKITDTPLFLAISNPHTALPHSNLPLLNMFYIYQIDL